MISAICTRVVVKVYQSSSKSDKIGIGRKCRYKSLVLIDFVPQSFYAPRGPKGVARATPSSREMIFKDIGDQRKVVSPSLLDVSRGYGT
jgi:hypothetical protein